MNAGPWEESVMPATIRRVSYFYVMVPDRPGQAYRLLSTLASGEVKLLAFNTVPAGPDHTQLVLFPEDPERLVGLGRQAGFTLDGPHRALLVQGDDELGALVGIHGRLTDAGVNVYAAYGVCDGRGGFGYLVYVRPEEFEHAARTLGAN
jgi:hypothetical protein